MESEIISHFSQWTRSRHQFWLNYVKCAITSALCVGSYDENPEIASKMHFFLCVLCILHAISHGVRQDYNCRFSGHSILFSNRWLSDERCKAILDLDKKKKSSDIVRILSLTSLNGTKLVHITNSTFSIRIGYKWRFSTKHEIVVSGTLTCFLMEEVNSYLFKLLDLSLLEHGEHVGRGPLCPFCTSFLLLGLSAGLKH